MAVRWRINWKGEQGGEYSLEIHDEGWTGDVVRLQGAASPFVTEEDDDEDFFLPVRVQRGHINIVDSGKDMDGGKFDWTEIMPSSARERKVELRKSGSIVWRGWIEPETYSGDYGVYPQERSYSVVDGLALLSGEDFNVNDYTLQDYTGNFAKLLGVLLDGWTNVIFQLDSVENVQEWLTTRINWWVFTDDGKVKMTKGEVLEEVCKYFGWSCRASVNTVYFLTPDVEAKLVNILYSSMITAGETGELYGGATLFSTTTDLNEVLMGDECTETIVSGWRKATVKADIGKMGELIQIPWDELNEWDRQRYVSDVEDDVFGARGHIFTLMKDDTTRWRTFNGTRVMVGGLFGWPKTNAERGAGFVIDDWAGDNEIEEKHNYEWKTSLRIFRQDDEDYMMKGEAGAGHAPVVTIESLWPITIQGSTLWMTAEVDKELFSPYSGNNVVGFDCSGYLVMEVIVGDKRLSIGGDTDAKPGEFLDIVPVGTMDGYTSRVEKKGSGAVLDSRIFSSEEGEYNGYGWRVPGVVSGTLRVNIYAVKCWPLEEYNEVRNWMNVQHLRMGIVQDLTETPHSTREVNDYEASNDSGWKEEKEVSTMLATWNNNMPGVGIVMDAENRYKEKFRKVMMGEAMDVIPELELAERMAAYGAKGRRQVTVEVRMNVPQHMRCRLDGREYMPMSVSKDWMAESSRVVLMEV